MNAYGRGMSDMTLAHSVHSPLSPQDAYPQLIHLPREARERPRHLCGDRNPVNIVVAALREGACPRK